MDKQDAVQFLEDVMAIPSVNGRDDEGKVAEYLASYLQGAGLEASVIRIDPTHANVTAYLPGRTGSEKKKPDLWNGHIDTVPYGSAGDWHSDPAVPLIKDGSLYGRGASDMKSGLCAMVYALCECQRRGIQPERPVRFVGTCDEEKGGLGARHFARNEDMTSFHSFLIGEPTGLRMGLAQKGCLWLKICAAGKTSHGAYPEEGCSALTHTLCVADEIKTYVEAHTHSLLGRSTANITMLKAGTAPNMIPETCEALLDIRFTPDLTAEEIFICAEAAVQKETQLSKGLFQAQLLKENHRRAFEIAEDAQPVIRLRECMEREGIGPESVGINFFTDASVMAGDLPEAQVVLFGPGEPGMAHKANEQVDLKKYLKAIRVFERMLGME